MKLSESYIEDGTLWLPGLKYSVQYGDDRCPDFPALERNAYDEAPLGRCTRTDWLHQNSHLNQAQHLLLPNPVSGGICSRDKNNIVES